MASPANWAPLPQIKEKPPILCRSAGGTGRGLCRLIGGAKNPLSCLNFILDFIKYMSYT